MKLSPLTSFFQCLTALKEMTGFQAIFLLSNVLCEYLFGLV